MRRETAVIVMAIVMGFAASFSWWFNETGRILFPASSVRAMPPSVPTLPDLDRMHPLPVPGFQDIGDCITPTLTADLTAIIFSRKTSDETGWDLYESTRTSRTEPFGDPSIIVATASPESEAYPAISPDGLELIFVRFNERMALWRSSRRRRTDSFSAPDRWEILTSEAGNAETRVGSPQFLTSEIVVFSQTDKTGKRTLWSCERNGGTFSTPQLEATLDGTSVLFLSADRKRAYYGTSRGSIYLTSRRTRLDPFLPAEELVKNTGAVHETIWLAPQEDVIVYSSSTSGSSGTDHRLWQVRF